MNLPIRPAAPTDRNYIIKSWVSSLRDNYPFSAYSKDAVAKLAKRVEALVSVATTSVICDPQDPDVVYGFICYETGEYLGQDIPTLHYIWVRKKFRRNKIANTLIKGAFSGKGGISYTTSARIIKHASLKEKWGLANFDPYLIEGALYRDARRIDAKAYYGRNIPAQGGLAL